MNSGKSEFRKDLQNMFAGYGIDFNIVPYFPGVPVQGYIRKKDYRIYQMFLTLRGASADIFWFSLFHELGHIANGDISRSGIYIDGEKSENVQREKNADLFAANALLEPDSCRRFLENGSFTYESIQSYAISQRVPPYIVIRRLQKEGMIPWNRYQKYKPKYHWADL